MKRGCSSPEPRRQKTQVRDSRIRDWDSTYEGFPNASVTNVCHDGTIEILASDGKIFKRQVSSFRYCVGRRGSLEYLSPELRREIGVVDAAWVSADTLRRRVEREIEAAPGVFAVGSLTGDSLVRYGFGGCTIAAGRILGERAKGVAEAGGIDRGVGMVVKANKRNSWSVGGCVVC